MITASEARKTVEESIRRDSAESIGDLSASLEVSVKAAVARKEFEATAELPGTMSRETALLVKRGFEKLNYKVVLKEETAHEVAKIYREPRRFITLHW